MKFQSTYPKITNADLAEFGTRVGFSLSEEYSQFLLEHNGGRSVECVCTVPGFGVSIVNDFFGINTKDSCDLELAIERYKDRIPDGLLPIADDPAGNLFLLSFRGTKAGLVFFWDHENESTDDSCELLDFKNVYQVAESLATFQEMLKPED